MLARVNGTDLYYEVIGEGRPLMLMHGGLGLDHTYFRPWLDPLAAHYQLIFYDHSGNGRSPRPQGFDGVSHATWADEADALRAHLGLDRIVLLGQSYGGFIAQEYALRHPDRLDGLILLCTAPALDYPEVIFANAQRRGTPEQIAVVAEDLGKPAENDEAFRRLWNTIVPLYFKRYDPGIAEAVDTQTHYSAGAFNHSFGVCLPTYNTTARLPEISTPTLILSGREDWITPPEQGERMRALLPNAEFVIFEESGHFPFVEEQQAFLTTVEEWLARLP
jgi:proline iminopeptidase